jgi:hypothetical protein
VVVPGDTSAIFDRDCFWQICLFEPKRKYEISVNHFDSEAVLRAAARSKAATALRQRYSVRLQGRPITCEDCGPGESQAIYREIQEALGLVPNPQST